MQTKIINKIFETFDALNPAPKTELVYDNHFTLLIAIVLSAQSTDASVNKATEKLFPGYDTPEKIQDLGEESLKNYIKTIGLYNAKAKNIIALSKILIEHYDSKIPDNFEALIKLPGVGRKTANVFLNCVHNLPTMPVDTHVFRVTSRLGLANEKNPEKTELKLLEVIPKKWLGNAHHWLVLHGRYICKARLPLCSTCPVKEYCKYYSNNYTETQ